jgi:hypothetical protein
VLTGSRFSVDGQRRATTKGFLFGSALFGMLVLLQPPAIRAEVGAARAYWWAIVPLFWAVCVGYALLLARQLSAGSRTATAV